MSAIELIIVVFCMFGCAFFAGIETGVISINRMRLKHFLRQGMHEAAILAWFIEKPERLLGTTLVGTNLCMVALSVITASMAASTIGRGWGEAAAIVMDTMVILVFCEYLPKAWFHNRPFERCKRFAGLLKIAEVTLRPISSTVLWLTRWFVPPKGRDFSQTTRYITKDDLKALVGESERNGVLTPDEHFMINRVFDLSRKRAGDVMVPSDKMRTVFSETTVEDFLKLSREAEFTRMPVLDRKTMKFVGVANMLFVLTHNLDKSGSTVAEVMRQPLFIPKDMPAADVLPRLRRSRQPMAIVVDDFAQPVGLVTTEDILNAIVKRPLSTPSPEYTQTNCATTKKKL